MSLSVESAVTSNQSLCIEATAGSGKTTLMVERLRYLIIEKQVPPERCLAITFTEKAAKEMIERLRKVFAKSGVKNPQEVVSKMSVSTIHAFCHKILKKYALCINLSPHYRIVDHIEKQQACMQHLSNMLAEYKYDPPQWLLDCLSVWSVPQLEKIAISAYDHRETIGYWFSNGFFNIDPEILEAHAQHAQTYKKTMTALSQFVSSYLARIEASKQSEGWQDYDDILYLTYQLFANVDWLRHQMQEQYQYIFVDEFQDTSPIQWKIVQQLCSDTDAYASRKLWVVGDRCQAIYGFRGADDALMGMVIDTQHPALGHVKNTQNYRSHATIIRWINQLFQRLFTDQGATFLQMEPQKQVGEASIHCYIVDAEYPEKELSKIKQHIAQYMEHGGRYKDIAILVRKNYDIKRINAYLQQNGIPMHVSKGAGLCEQDSVQVMICLIQGLLDVGDTIAWYGIARDILEVPDTDLEALNSVDGGFVNALAGYTNNGVAQTIKDWTAAMQSGDMWDALDKIIWTLPLRKTWGSEDRQAVERFLGECQAVWESQEYPINAVLDWLGYCVAHPKALGIEKEAEQDAVQVMTLHAAKGLEFPMIIVPFLDAPFNFGATDPMIYSREHGLGVSMGKSSDNVIRKTIFGHQKAAAILEELRLFYVTLTRAKQHVVLTGKQLKRKNMSRLTLLLPYLECAGDDTYKWVFQADTAAAGDVLDKESTEETAVAHVWALPTIPVETVINMWSVSNVLDYVECPKLMGLKAERSLDIGITEQQQQGEERHGLMAYLLTAKEATGEGVCNPSVLEKAVAMFSDADGFPEKDIEAFVQMVWGTQWFKDLTEGGRLLVEYPFEYRYKGHMIRGRFDAVWFDDNAKTFRVVEFKRSFAGHSKRYNLQVLMYAHIVEAMFSGYKFDVKQSMLVHLQTGETQAIVDRDGEVLGLLEQLPQKGAVLEPNPSACKACAYADKVLRCEETGFVIGS